MILDMEYDILEGRCARCGAHNSAAVVEDLPLWLSSCHSCGHPLDMLLLAEHRHATSFNGYVYAGNGRWRLSERRLPSYQEVQDKIDELVHRLRLVRRRHGPSGEVQERVYGLDVRLTERRRMLSSATLVVEWRLHGSGDEYKQCSLDRVRELAIRHRGDA